MTDAAAPRRVIPDRLDTSLSRTLKSWEALLLAVAVAIFIANSLASPISSIPGTSPTPPSTSRRRP